MPYLKNMVSKLLCGFLALLAPVLSFAADVDHLHLAGKNTWDMYTYGNGKALSDVMTSVTLMVAPDRPGAFHYLLLVMAIVGFVVMAVKAGFDPAKNFTKMFAFILLVVFVQYATHGARVNMNIIDKDGQNTYTVDDVPAIVGVPASLISNVGEWLTRQIETNFRIPNTLQIGDSGKFNLFAKVYSDLDKYTITNQALKKTVSAYIADCAIPAMARGRLSADQLMNSDNLVATLGKATHNAIMTRYFPQVETPGQPGACAALPPLNSDGSANYSPGLGALMTCAQVYPCMKADLEAHAQELVEGSAEAWSTTGVNTGYEQVMIDSLALAGLGSSGTRPQGLVLQKAMINSMDSSFRSAVARTGNGETMSAVAIAQAEQSQKTSWWTAAEIFKNMMGYVYLVLQAFIFAVVPIVIVGLLIPGLGGKIFANYFQIMVWLALWMPLLAVINYLITLFGSAQLEQTLKIAGLTPNNSGIVSENSNNMVIAAQFLATLVPLITWGLVKGAMAFTEFISHGIGSSFATQAGAQASTGNVSMGNLSMDNTGMNKFSTQSSVAVGSGAVDVALGSGYMNSKMSQGGSTMEGAGGSMQVKRTVTDSWSFGSGDSFSQGMTKAQAESTASNISKSASEVDKFMEAASKQLSALEAADQSISADDKDAVAKHQKIDAAKAQIVEASNQIATKWDGQVKLALRGSDIGFSAGMAATKTQLDKASRTLQAANSLTAGHDSSTSSGQGYKTSNSSGHSQSWSSDRAKSFDESYQKMESIRNDLSKDTRWAQSLDFRHEQKVSYDYSSNLASTGLEGHEMAMSGASGAVGEGGASVAAHGAATAKSVNAGLSSGTASRSQAGMDGITKDAINGGIGVESQAAHANSVDLNARKEAVLAAADATRASAQDVKNHERDLGTQTGNAIERAAELGQNVAGVPVLKANDGIYNYQ